jgi:hypothetical protein
MDFFLVYTTGRQIFDSLTIRSTSWSLLFVSIIFCSIFDLLSSQVKVESGSGDSDISTTRIENTVGNCSRKINCDITLNKYL